MSSLFELSGKKRTYWLTRFMILRLLGIVYAVAFLVAIQQIIPLIGVNGLTPVGIYLQEISTALGSQSAAFWKLPSLFWFWHSDTALLTVSWIGFILSCLVALGFANAIIMAALWILYMSIVHVGQIWYGYGWEIQLLETGFLAIFLCPLVDMRMFPKRKAPLPVIFLFRFLIFRIMLGAGMIKLRGSKLWSNATALFYHFETQPLPGPLSRWFFFLPHFILKIGVWYNWLAELVAPFFAFGPRITRHIAGIVMIMLQVILILSGNLSFLNWLTIVPALACFDDGFWATILPGSLVRKAEEAENHSEESKPMKITSWVVVALVAVLSIQPLMNILSPTQIMNTSYDPFDLVNTYGAFGTVGEIRYNVVFEGTNDEQPDSSANWKPYIYKGLPVRLDERPPQVAPYHLRLDWQMWFASMASPSQYPWTLNLVWKLLQNDPSTLELFEKNPFPDGPPKYVRAVLYTYQFAKPDNKEGKWWKRERQGLWLPAFSTSSKDLLLYLKERGWVKE
ncbi:membrane protein [Christiangramia fulva]|uniref:Membrane protein n=1 Tax=Christiangramia fulva TaxID=2126553 RepID=A0A2R3Z2B0_9FLAO|nr:lipase maturation factor family protein [Christiangramia fulva]AVR44411.1 membrane protein [Christiangramia fulva]